ncbi:MAG: MFS transporter, partial [Gemmobacter sp.]
IIAVSGWRGIFAACLVFAAISITWLGLRQPETLPRAGRRPLNGAALTEALREVLRHPVVRSAIMVQSMVFAALFATLSSIQQVFDLTFGLAREFPVWFALIALTAGSASLLNAALVVRLGMRRMVRTSLAVQVAASALMAAATFAGVWTGQTAFPAFLVWVTGVFFMAGLTLGNVNAIAMEPMGHIAGMAASAVAALATVASVVIAVPIGLSFDGTPAPLMAGVALTCAAGLWLMRRLPG